MSTRPGRFGNRRSSGTVRSGGGGRSFTTDPLIALRRLSADVLEALDPSRAPSKVKRLTPDEIAVLNASLKKRDAP